MELKLKSLGETKINGMCMVDNFTFCSVKCDALAEKAVVVIGGCFCNWSRFCAMISLARPLLSTSSEKSQSNCDRTTNFISGKLRLKSFVTLA